MYHGFEKPKVKGRFCDIESEKQLTARYAHLKICQRVISDPVCVATKLHKDGL